MRTIDIQLIITMIGALLTDLIDRHPDETTFVQMEQQLRVIFFNLVLDEPDATADTAATAEESQND